MGCSHAAFSVRNIQVLIPGVPGEMGPVTTRMFPQVQVFCEGLDSCVNPGSRSQHVITGCSFHGISLRENFFSFEDHPCVHHAGSPVLVLLRTLSRDPKNTASPRLRPPPEFLVSHVLKPGRSDGRMMAKSFRTGRTSRSASLGHQSSHLKMD